MAVILLLVDIYFVIASLFMAFICRRSQTPVNTWLCGNTSSTNSSSASLADTFGRIELVDLLSLASFSAVLISNATFFWCMWKLQQRTVYCVTLEKAFSTAGRSIWVTLKVLLRSNLGICFLLRISKMYVKVTYRAKFGVQIRSGSVFICTAIFVNVLPPLLDSKNDRE